MVMHKSESNNQHAHRLTHTYTHKHKTAPRTPHIYQNVFLSDGITQAKLGRKYPTTFIKA